MEQQTALTATLPLEQWNLLLEIIDLVPKPHLKAVAINMLKSQLDEQFEQLNKPVNKEKQ